MIDNIRTDESIQVLVFVCVPLLLVLVAIVVLLTRGPRYTAKFPTFSVTITKIGREEAYVIYRDKNKDVEFAAEIGKGKSFFVPQICVRVPKERPVEDVANIVPNLALGLKKLRYQYLIYRPGALRKIPEEERDAAIAELRQMGVEMKKSQSDEKIQRAVVHNWRRISGDQSEDVVPRLLGLMSKARGIRESIEVLARSDSVGLGSGEGRGCGFPVPRALK